MLRSWFSPIALAASLLAASGAHAQWQYEKGQDDPFKGGTEHYAMTASPTGMMAAFRCVKREDLALMLITYEKPNIESSLGLALSRVRLLVIIDDTPKVSMEAAAEITPDGEHYRITAAGPSLVSVLLKAAGATQRMALAAEVDGEVAISESFGVSGSRRALQPLIDGCDLRSGR